MPTTQAAWITSCWAKPGGDGEPPREGSRMPLDRRELLTLGCGRGPPDGGQRLLILHQEGKGWLTGSVQRRRPATSTRPWAPSSSPAFLCTEQALLGKRPRFTHWGYGRSPPPTVTQGSGKDSHSNVVAGCGPCETPGPVPGLANSYGASIC